MNWSENVDHLNRWHAVQIKRMAFRVAARGLMRQGHYLFVPTIESVVVRFGKRRAEPKLMFPGYIFVAVDPAQPNWRAINNTEGVSRLVMASPTTPATVPSGFIAGLRARCDSEGCFKAADDLKTGDPVYIVSGPFAGLLARIDKLDDQQRVHILMEILSGMRQLTIGRDQLRRAV